MSNLNSVPGCPGCERHEKDWHEHRIEVSEAMIGRPDPDFHLLSLPMQISMLRAEVQRGREQLAQEQAKTQEAIAWLLLRLTPEAREEIERTARLWPLYERALQSVAAVKR